MKRFCPFSNFLLLLFCLHIRLTFHFIAKSNSLCLFFFKGGQWGEVGLGIGKDKSIAFVCIAESIISFHIGLGSKTIFVTQH